jgi:AcrR family transcriptional regulator
VDKRLKPFRRDEILGQARELFSRFGFRGVTLDEIGTVVGITGPAIYRHFPNKESLLVAIFEEHTTRLMADVRHARESATSPYHMLELLAESQIDLCLDERAMTQVYINEARNLPPAIRARVDTRRREYVRAWGDALAAVRPDLSRGERRVRVFAGMWAINSLGYYTANIEQQDLRRIVRRSCLAALLAEPDAGDTPSTTSSPADADRR